MDNREKYIAIGRILDLERILDVAIAAHFFPGMLRMIFLQDVLNSKFSTQDFKCHLFGKCYPSLAETIGEKIKETLDIKTALLHNSWVPGPPGSETQYRLPSGASSSLSELSTRLDALIDQVEPIILPLTDNVLMVDSLSADDRRNLEVIDETISKLITMIPETSPPASIPRRYIGTIIANTATLLTAPANLLDRAGRFVASSLPAEEFKSSIQSVHRSFYTSLIQALELALKEICRLKDIEITAHNKTKRDKLYDQIAPSVGNSGDAYKALKKLQKYNTKSHFEAADYLNAALSATNLDDLQNKRWRAYFRALTIVRNKSSHSDTSLSEGEKTELRNGELGECVSDDGVLVINPTMYLSNLTRVLELIDALMIDEKPAA